MAKTIDIHCSECGKTITMSAKDANIVHRFNGGCPTLKVTVMCPHCGNSSAVPDTFEARELLADRINNGDFKENSIVIVASSPEALDKLVAKS